MAVAEVRRPLDAKRTRSVVANPILDPAVQAIWQGCALRKALGEVISRVIVQFRDEKLVRREDGAYVIVDPARLHMASEQD